ncbi:MAG: tRNA1(Val) (adenine(37)-N6)-methyltransferase [Clostridia bacterium]|nr:tRNA1(Val) (adenine(37)-N6)-methyltransferase [Clostridia bacterium]
MKSTDYSSEKCDETIENLGNGYFLIQGKAEFRFGTDAVKLADFANVKPTDTVMDLCTGTGIIPILLHKKAPGIHVTGLELQPQMCEMAQRSVKLNNLTDNISIMQGDLCQIRSLFPAESFQVVTCNPPYMKDATGKQNELDAVTIARHEVCCTLEDCISAAAYLLPSGGRLCMVHRPERLADIIASMRAYRIEPKRLTLFAAKNRPPRLLVIEGQKNRNSGLIVELKTGEKS